MSTVLKSVVGDDKRSSVVFVEDWDWRVCPAHFQLPMTWFDATASPRMCPHQKCQKLNQNLK